MSENDLTRLEEVEIQQIKTPAPPQPVERRRNPVMMTAIICATIVAMTCILATMGIMLTFLINPPW